MSFILSFIKKVEQLSREVKSKDLLEKEVEQLSREVKSKDLLEIEVEQLSKRRKIQRFT